ASRIADGLYGAIARATRPTDRGSFLDIALDFLVYAADDRLHDCLLLVSNRVSHSCDNFRHTMLDLGSQPSRSRVEVAGGGGLKRTALPARVRMRGKTITPPCGPVSCCPTRGRRRA